MNIEEFIEIVYPKIPKKSLTSYDLIKGSDLLLGGAKEVKGKPINPNKAYKMAVPVQVVVDHKKKLRLAWLRGGKQGVRNHLSKFLNKDVLEAVMSVL